MQEFVWKVRFVDTLKILLEMQMLDVCVEQIL